MYIITTTTKHLVSVQIFSSGLSSGVIT